MYIVSALLLFILPATVWGYGAWETVFTYDDGDVNDPMDEFTDAAIALYDPDVVVLAGRLFYWGLDIDTTIEDAWISTDGGENLAVVHQHTFGRDSCSVNMGYYAYCTAAAAIDAQTWLLACREYDHDCPSNYTPEQMWKCIWECGETMQMTIQRTEDGGQTFTWADPGFEYYVNDLLMLNEEVGFAASDHSNLSRTEDGGRTWARINLSPEHNNYDITDLQFLDEEVGYMIMKMNVYYPDEAQGKLLKTEDGGDTWQVISEDYERFYLNFHFLDEEEGFTVVQESTHYPQVEKTVDGGETWFSIMDEFPTGPRYERHSGVYDIKFSKNKELGIILGLTAVSPEKSFEENLFVIYTENQGKTWKFDASSPYNDGWTENIVLWNDKRAFAWGRYMSLCRYTADNLPPTADAGGNQEGFVGEEITLSGYGSTDPDGDELNYQWEQLDGPYNVEFKLDEQGGNLSFVPAQIGTYTFRLTVSDWAKESDSDETTATVAEAPIDDDEVDDDTDDDDAGDDNEVDDDNDDEGCGC